MTKFLNISTDNTLGGASPSDETVSSQKAIKEYVDGQDAGFVTLSTSQTITGLKSFNTDIEALSYIKGTTETGSNKTNHAIALGHSNVNHMDFYEYGGVYNFYKSRGGTNTLLMKLNDTTSSIMQPTEDTTTSSQIDTVGARNTKLANYVTTNTNQTITGTKTCRADQRYGCSVSTADLTQQSTANEYWYGIRYTDANGVQGGLYQYYRNTSGTAQCNIQARAISTNSWAKIAVYQQADGTSFATCPQPTEDTTTSDQIDTVGARNTKLASYLPSADQGCIIPNFDGMTAVQTIEFDTSNTSWKTIFTRTNTETAQSDLNDVLYFRITVTGTNIHQVADFVYMLGGREGYRPTVLVFNRAGTTDANYGGFRYFRFYAPKALNNGYGYGCEVIQNRNSNARHYKVEVFKTNSKVTWVQGTASSYNSTYQNGWQYTIEANAGLYICYAYGTINVADNAGYITSTLRKIINSGQNMQAGANILANQFVFMNGGKVYPMSSTTVAIEPCYGLHRSLGAFTTPNNVSYDNIVQKSRLTDLTNVPHATLARGNQVYLRCTTDSSGNIYSDNYVATSMSAGYTWYYIGIAESATAIDIDTTQSFFMTLDANGKLTHVNGKGIAADLSAAADKDLSNLSDDGKNIANWSDNASNCITSKSKDVNIEVSRDSSTFVTTVTVKAGTKYYKSDGTSYTLATDKQVVIPNPTISGLGEVFYIFPSTTIPSTGDSYVRSDDVGITSGGTSHNSVIFDTTDNNLYKKENGTLSLLEFPVASIRIRKDVDTVDYVSIFNTVGNLVDAEGSSSSIVVFVLPNISGKIPNGKNSDGTCNNINYTNTGIGIYCGKVYSNDTTNPYVLLNNDGSVSLSSYIISDTLGKCTTYLQKENKVYSYDSGTSTYTQSFSFPVAKLKYTNFYNPFGGCSIEEFEPLVIVDQKDIGIFKSNINTPSNTTRLFSFGGPYTTINSNRAFDLSESWRNFDMIGVRAASSAAGARSNVYIIPTYWLAFLIETDSPLIWTNGSGYLAINSINASSNPSTDTSLYCSVHSGAYLAEIWGINHK